MKAISGLTTLLAVVYAQCIIHVPADPLSAKGLATPYTVTGCDQTNPKLTSFVEGGIYDPATNIVSVYSPLMINANTKPAISPVDLKLPVNAVVALWFGSNADNITLKGAANLVSGKCVNGLKKGDIFTQFAYCNAPAFFKAAQNITIPSLGRDKNGALCPTTRDFSLVDADPSDNVVTQYLLSKEKRLAQHTAANIAKLGSSASILDNGSDNRLLISIQPLISCHPLVGPNLADNNTPTQSLALNELQAARFQQNPIALIPDNDAMVLVNGARNKQKLKLYRVGVNQDPNAPSDTKTYCRNFVSLAPKTYLAQQTLTEKAASPDPTRGSNMFTFLCARFSESYVTLKCQALTGIKNPLHTHVNKNGVTTSCQLGSGPSVGISAVAAKTRSAITQKSTGQIAASVAAKVRSSNRKARKAGRGCRSSV